MKDTTRLRRLERLLDELTAPTSSWRMARAVDDLNPPSDTGQAKSARTRRRRALAKVDELVRDYVAETAVEPVFFNERRITR